MEIENKEDLHCHYSDLPSPMAYCTDYDSMGNHGRFPKKKEKPQTMKRLIRKIALWLDVRKMFKRKKSIWDV